MRLLSVGITYNCLTSNSLILWSIKLKRGSVISRYFSPQLYITLELIQYMLSISTPRCPFLNITGNNSRPPDIFRTNFENDRPISHYDRTRWWPNISPAHLELSSARSCMSVNKLCLVQFVKCAIKRKIWKDLCPVHYEQLFTLYLSTRLIPIFRVWLPTNEARRFLWQF